MLQEWKKVIKNATQILTGSMNTNMHYRIDRTELLIIYRRNFI